MNQYHLCNGFPQRISDRNISIYEPLDEGHQDLWIPTSELERLLNEGLIGFGSFGIAGITGKCGCGSRILAANYPHIWGVPQQIPKSRELMST